MRYRDIIKKCKIFTNHEENAMKRVWLVGIVLSFMAVAVGFSLPAPSDAPLSDEALTAILGQPAGAECALPQDGLVLPDQPPGPQFMTCSATATCNDTSGINVSCNFGSSGGTCTFENQDCAAGIRGQVICNGTVTQCPSCPCGTPACCKCAADGDCFYCCRCDGGTITECRALCM
jgi:hypothetical protein